MIAAQLLAYYFTELKDDQVKKVSFLSIHLLIFVFSSISNAWQQVTGACVLEARESWDAPGITSLSGSSFYTSHRARQWGWEVYPCQWRHTGRRVCAAMSLKGGCGASGSCHEERNDFFCVPQCERAYWRVWLCVGEGGREHLKAPLPRRKRVGLQQLTYDMPLPESFDRVWMYCGGRKRCANRAGIHVRTCLWVSIWRCVVFMLMAC